MVVVAQLVRAPDCGSGGRGFETHLPPLREPFGNGRLFLWDKIRKSKIYPSLLSASPAQPGEVISISHHRCTACCGSVFRVRVHPTEKDNPYPAQFYPARSG